jgi:hypothetical protein
MDVLLTPDIISDLQITSCALSIDGKTTYFCLLAFSETHITFITSEQPPIIQSVIKGVIQTGLEISRLDFVYEAQVRTSSKHWIMKFSYSMNQLEPELKSRMNEHLHISSFRQMRKDERIVISKETVSTLLIQSVEIPVWFRSKKTCVLRDLSFSGARLFSSDDIVLDCDDKLVMAISFVHPTELATIRATVVRLNRFKVNDVDCFDVAVRFIDPVDLVLLRRMTRFFDLASLEAKSKDCLN